MSGDLNDIINSEIHSVFKDFSIKSHYCPEDINSRDFDARIRLISEKIFNACKLKKSSETLSRNKISIVMSTVYNSGGHTPLALNIIDLLKEKFNLFFHLLDQDSLSALSDNKQEALKQHASIININKYQQKDFIGKILHSYLNLISCKASTIFALIHPDDIVHAIVFNLLKMTHNLKIIFINHADHKINLGMNSSDLIIDFRSVGAQATNISRGYYNNLVLNFPISSNTRKGLAEKQAVRKVLGLSSCKKISITACSPYKIYTNCQDYFLMIKSLLEKNQDLTHLLNDGIGVNKSKARSIINNENLFQRIVFRDMSDNYEDYFQCANVFIDSFFQGSALTHVDCMRLGLPTVVKINNKEPLKSFQDYLPFGYKYMSSNTNELENIIHNILNDTQLQDEISKDNLEWFNSIYKQTNLFSQYSNLI